MLSIVKMTHTEKVKMYEKHKKGELINMLIAANDAIDILSVGSGNVTSSEGTLTTTEDES